MSNIGYNTLREDEEIVETLLRLPVKNLEARISQLESEITQRRKIQDEILSSLRTFRLQTEDRIWRLRYAHLSPHGSHSLETERRELLQLESQIHLEQRAGFKDFMSLNERLQFALEEYGLASERLKLLETAETLNGNNDENTSGSYKQPNL